MMNQYDFLNLSYVEFEELCRDLLEKEWGIRLESFSEGTDGGIDLRYLRHKKKQWIVQCKRYSAYKDLYAALKKELPKLTRFTDTTYKIATSVSLSPVQKQKIVELLNPYLESPADILAKKDLNALLRKHTEVEKAHFKLWIQSIAMLESILKSKVINQSKFEMDQIRALMKVYVVNPSFEQAETILENKRFVVISGIPGIGKTTLARVLAYMYLSRKKYGEFVYLSDSIDEGYELYKEGVKQVFLFDDFLGQSFSDRTLNRNEDKRIMEFIKKIYKSRDKVLLFTTREYILRDVQLKHDLLSDPDIDFAKCLIDLSSYTNLIKAKILYNHLYFSGLPTPHLKVYAQPKVYKKIIEHDSYSPRILETLIRQELANLTDPDSFVQTIIQSLDNPLKVWEAPFTRQINDLSRWLLTILLTMGTPVIIDDLKKACTRFAEVHGDKYFPAFNNALFLQSIKELENSFVITRKDDDNTRVLEFQNPSVRDFLLHYFESNKDQLLPIIEAAVFQEQLFAMFTTKASDNKKEQPFIRVARKIVHDDAMSQAILKKIEKEAEQLKGCRVFSYTMEGSDNKYYSRSSTGQYEILQKTHDRFKDTDFEERANVYVFNRFEQMLSLPASTTSTDEVEAYIGLLKVYHNRLPTEPEMIVNQVAGKFNSLFQYKYYFHKLNEIFPDEYDSFVASEIFQDKVYDLALREIKQVKANKIDDMVNTLESIQDTYHLDFTEEIKELSPPELDEEMPDDKTDHFDYMEEQERSEPDEIAAIFDSFRSME
ncbi:MAG: restriction endonuclease [Bacteroidetes bacterium]|nr:restriction endonuclease [Bacteroidota bacterium]